MDEQVIKESNYILNIRLYYNYRGNYKWLKDEIYKKRYDAFKYLMPVEKKEDHNFIFEIYKLKDDNENMYISLVYYDKLFNIFNVNRILNDKTQIPLEQGYLIYNYLKETYFEKE